jgi:hypothetical protein
MIVSYVMQLHGALLLLPSRGNTDVTLVPYMSILSDIVHIIVIVFDMFLFIKIRLIRTFLYANKNMKTSHGSWCFL